MKDGARTPLADRGLLLSLSDVELDPMHDRTDRARAIIRHGILTGRLRPGEQLVEAEIADMLQMSKTPVREAIKSLAGSGLISLGRYKGAVVREFDLASASAVYDMRLLLEPEAVQRSVAAGGPFVAALAALDRASRAGDVGDLVEMGLANREFHHALYVGCGNPLLVSTLDALREQAALISVAEWRVAGGWAPEVSEHRSIVEAAIAGDAGLARTLVEQHIREFVARTMPTVAAAIGSRAGRRMPPSPLHIAEPMEGQP